MGSQGIAHCSGGTAPNRSHPNELPFYHATIVARTYAGTGFVFSYFLRGDRLIAPIFPPLSGSDSSISLASEHHCFPVLCIEVVGDVLEKVVAIVSDLSDLRIWDLALHAVKSARSKSKKHEPA